MAQSASLIERLPHRPPFRFITDVLAAEPGAEASGSWSVTGEEPFLAGHFPGRPVVPGVLIAEALAQLAGLAAPSGLQDARLAHVDVRFLGPTVPPARIELHAKLLRSFSSLHLFEVDATVEGRRVASGQLSLAEAGA